MNLFSIKAHSMSSENGDLAALRKVQLIASIVVFWGYCSSESLKPSQHIRVNTNGLGVEAILGNRNGHCVDMTFRNENDLDVGGTPVNVNGPNIDGN